MTKPKPNVKLPKAVENLIRDLRDRRLLPVAILLVAAILTVPLALLLTGGSDIPEGSGESDLALAGTDSAVAVVAGEEGVRNYKRRLAGDGRDPFKQKFLPKQNLKGSQLGDGSGLSGPGVPGSGLPSGFSGPTDINLNQVVNRFYTHTIDVLAGEAGQLRRQNGVDKYSVLPSRLKPLVVFVGVNDAEDKALFTISTDADPLAADDPLAGNGACVLPGSGGCEMLSLEVGQSRGFSYAVDEQVYQIKLLAIHKVAKK